MLSADNGCWQTVTRWWHADAQSHGTTSFLYLAQSIQRTYKESALHILSHVTTCDVNWLFVPISWNHVSLWSEVVNSHTKLQISNWKNNKQFAKSHCSSDTCALVADSDSSVPTILSSFSWPPLHTLRRSFLLSGCCLSDSPSQLFNQIITHVTITCQHMRASSVSFRVLARSTRCVTSQRRGCSSD